MRARACVCALLGDRRAELEGTTQHLCDVLVTGVFPTLVVTDARCHGSAVGISKKQLWTLFSLDTLVAVLIVAVVVAVVIVVVVVVVVVSIHLI